MDLYSGSIISLVLFLNPLFTTPSFLFALFAALQHCLFTLRLFCTITPKSRSLSCTPRSLLPSVKSKLLLLNPKCKTEHLSMLNLICQSFEQYPQILPQSIHFLFRSYSSYQLSIVSKLKDPTFLLTLTNVLSKSSIKINEQKQSQIRFLWDPTLNPSPSRCHIVDNSKTVHVFDTPQVVKVGKVESDAALHPS